MLLPSLACLQQSTTTLLLFLASPQSLYAQRDIKAYIKGQRFLAYLTDQ